MEIFKLLLIVGGICTIRYLFQFVKDQPRVCYDSKPKLFQVCARAHEGECCLIAPSGIQTSQKWLDQVESTLAEALIPDLSDIVLEYLQTYICIWIGKRVHFRISKTVYFKEYWQEFRIQTIVVEGSKTFIQLSQGVNVKAKNKGEAGNNQSKVIEGTYSIDDPRIDYGREIGIPIVGPIGARGVQGVRPVGW